MSTSAVEVVGGVVAVAGTAISLCGLAALHLLPTGLSPLRNPVSQYGITDYRLGYRIQTLGMGVAALGCAVGIAKLSLPSDGLAVGLFALFGATRLLISWFPMDAPGSERTDAGRRHGLLALLAFASAAIGSLRFGAALGDARRWSTASHVIVGLGVLMVVALLVMGAARSYPAARQRFGAIERVWYVAAIAMLLLVGVELLRTR